ERVRVGGGVAEVEESPRQLDEKMEVFGIEVEYFHNYFVGEGEESLLVHNGPECLVRPGEIAGEWDVVLPEGKVLGRFWQREAAVQFSGRVNQQLDNPTGHARILGRD